jgi:hypothetical protein
VAAALTAELLGPADHKPAVLAHAAHRLAEGGAAELVPLGVEAPAQVADGEEAAVVPAQLVAQGLLFGGEVDVHGGLGTVVQAARFGAARIEPKANEVTTAALAAA